MTWCIPTSHSTRRISKARLRVYLFGYLVVAEEYVTCNAVQRNSQDSCNTVEPFVLITYPATSHRARLTLNPFVA
jgi:hypothetical protein